MLRSIINHIGRYNEYIKSREYLASGMQARARGKLFSYDMMIGNDTIGYCIINDIIYDRLIDSFIYIVTDIDTKCVYIADRCHICIKEVSV